MKKEYQFQQNLWDPSDFLYAASARFNYRENFIQEPNCIVNRYDDVRSDYSYISMVMKDRLPDGASVSTTCSFENYGAPLIVLCGKLHTLPNGMLQYGTHFEVVPFEDGLNVWYLTLENNQVKPVALARYRFPLRGNDKLSLRVTLSRQQMDIYLQQFHFTLHSDKFPTEYYAGITACEGINRFYDFSVEY